MARKKSVPRRQQEEASNNNTVEAEQPQNRPSSSSTSSSTPPRNIRNAPLCLQTDDQQVICKLPRHFGKNSWLFSTLNNEAKGLRHIIIRHENDFRTEENLVRQLQTHIKSENFIGLEYENRFVWEFVDFHGNTRELVLALNKKGKHYELFTAWKRSPVIREEDERTRSTESLLSNSVSWFSNLFACCFGICSSAEDEESVDEEEQANH